jgi:hypothetical protein
MNPFGDTMNPSPDAGRLGLSLLLRLLLPLGG